MPSRFIHVVAYDISFFSKAESTCFKSQNWFHVAIIIIQCFFREGSQDSYLGVHKSGQPSSISSQIYSPAAMPLLLLVLSMKSFSQDLLQHFFFLHCIRFLFLLKYSWFTMLCQFQVYSKAIHISAFIHVLFFMFFFLIGYYKVLSRVPCATIGPYCLPVLCIVMYMS